MSDRSTASSTSRCAWSPANRSGRSAPERVSDQGNFRIHKFSATGQPLASWGGSGSDHGQFMQLEGVAVDAKGNVLVADSGNNRISVFSPDGHLLAESGARGMRAGQFQGPAGIAVDASGAIFVSELYNHRVQRFV